MPAGRPTRRSSSSCRETAADQLRRSAGGAVQAARSAAHGAGASVGTAAAWPARRAEILRAVPRARLRPIARGAGAPPFRRGRGKRVGDGWRGDAQADGRRQRAGGPRASLRADAVPAERAIERPVPVFLLLNNRPATNTDPTRREKSGFWPAEQVIARGFGIAALQVGELAPDDKVRFRDGVIRLFEGTADGCRPANAWGALAAWAWGASRAMDYFVTRSANRREARRRRRPLPRRQGGAVGGRRGRALRAWSSRTSRAKAARR